MIGLRRVSVESPWVRGTMRGQYLLSGPKPSPRPRLGQDCTSGVCTDFPGIPGDEAPVVTDPDCPGGVCQVTREDAQPEPESSIEQQERTMQAAEETDLTLPIAVGAGALLLVLFS